MSGKKRRKRAIVKPNGGTGRILKKSSGARGHSSQR